MCTPPKQLLFHNHRAAARTGFAVLLVNVKVLLKASRFSQTILIGTDCAAT